MVYYYQIKLNLPTTYHPITTISNNRTIIEELLSYNEFTTKE